MNTDIVRSKGRTVRMGAMVVVVPVIASRRTQDIEPYPASYDHVDTTRCYFWVGLHLMLTMSMKDTIQDALDDLDVHIQVVLLQ